MKGFSHLMLVFLKTFLRLAAFLFLFVVVSGLLLIFEYNTLNNLDRRGAFAYWKKLPDPPDLAVNIVYFEGVHIFAQSDRGPLYCYYSEFGVWREIPAVFHVESPGSDFAADWAPPPPGPVKMLVRGSYFPNFTSDSFASYAYAQLADGSFWDLRTRRALPEPWASILGLGLLLLPVLLGGSLAWWICIRRRSDKIPILC